MTDVSSMELQEIRKRLYDLAILLRREKKCSFAATELDEKFNLHYGTKVPATKFGFEDISALLDGSRWFTRLADDTSLFVCILREKYDFAYKIPRNPNQTKVLIDLEPELWRLHIKKELEEEPPPPANPPLPLIRIKPEPVEIPPPASPVPSQQGSPPHASPPREEAVEEEGAQVARVIPTNSPPAVADHVISFAPLVAPHVENSASISVLYPEETARISAALALIQEETDEIAHKKTAKQKKKNETSTPRITPAPIVLPPTAIPQISVNRSSASAVSRNVSATNTAIQQVPIIPSSPPVIAPMPELSPVAEIHFIKLFNNQIASLLPLLGPSAPGLPLSPHEDMFVSHIIDVLETLGGSARFDEVEMEFRTRFNVPFAECCSKYLPNTKGPFNTLRTMSSGKIETEILGPRALYFHLKHPIDVLIDGVVECLRRHEGRSELSDLHTWFEENYRGDFISRSLDLFGSRRHLKIFREFVLLTGRFVMECGSKGRWYFGLKLEDLTPKKFWEAPKGNQGSPSATTATDASNVSGGTKFPPIITKPLVIDVLIDRIVECLKHLGGKASFRDLTKIYEGEIYKHSFYELVLHMFGSWPYQKFASVANPKKKFNLYLENGTWMFNIVEEVASAAAIPQEIREKQVTDRLIVCLRKMSDYCATAEEMKALYKKTHTVELDSDLISAFGTSNPIHLQFDDLRRKVQIYMSKTTGWMYRLGRSQRPRHSRSPRDRFLDRRRRAQTVFRSDSRERSRRSPTVYRSRRSPSRCRRSRSRSRQRSRSRERRNRSRRSPSIRNSRRSRSRSPSRSNAYTQPSRRSKTLAPSRRHSLSRSPSIPAAYDPRSRRGDTVRRSRSRSRRGSRSKEARNRSSRRDSSVESSRNSRYSRFRAERHRSSSGSSYMDARSPKKAKRTDSIALASEVEVGSSESKGRKKKN